MKVAELMAALDSCDPGMEVVIALDEEWNNFVPLGLVDGDDLLFWPGNRIYQDVFPGREVENEHMDIVERKAKPCVVLSPGAPE